MGVEMIQVCMAYAILGLKLQAFRYQARRAYAGQGLHGGVGRHRRTAAVA
jgi:hypothetical protein